MKKEEGLHRPFWEGPLRRGHWKHWSDPEQVYLLYNPNVCHHLHGCIRMFIVFIVFIVFVVRCSLFASDPVLARC